MRPSEAELDASGERGMEVDFHPRVERDRLPKVGVAAEPGAKVDDRRTVPVPLAIERAQYRCGIQVDPGVCGTRLGEEGGRAILDGWAGHFAAEQQRAGAEPLVPFRGQAELAEGAGEPFRPVGAKGGDGGAIAAPPRGSVPVAARSEWLRPCGAQCAALPVGVVTGGERCHRHACVHRAQVTRAGQIARGERLPLQPIATLESDQSHDPGPYCRAADGEKILIAVDDAEPDPVRHQVAEAAAGAEHHAAATAQLRAGYRPDVCGGKVAGKLPPPEVSDVSSSTTPDSALPKRAELTARMYVHRGDGVGIDCTRSAGEVYRAEERNAVEQHQVFRAARAVHAECVGVVTVGGHTGHPRQGVLDVDAAGGLVRLPARRESILSRLMPLGGVAATGSVRIVGTAGHHGNRRQKDGTRRQLDIECERGGVGQEHGELTRFVSARDKPQLVRPSSDAGDGVATGAIGGGTLDAVEFDMNARNRPGLARGADGAMDPREEDNQADQR